MLPLKLPSLICVILLSITAAEQSRDVFPWLYPKVERFLRQHIQVATWEEARHNCESEGALLASPLDADLLKHMKSIITVNNHATPYFIGIKAKHDKKVEFVSQEGVLLEDIPEALSLVEKLDSRNGDCLCMNGNSIQAVPCWTRLPYICYINITEENATTTETPTTVLADCNTGYIQNSETGSYYKFYDERNEAYWKDANSTCAADGGYLAIPNDPIEARMVKYIAFPPYYRWRRAYIGLRDIKGNGDWLSVHDDPIGNLYNVFQPTSTKGNCGVLTYDGKLEKYLCYDMLPFVCEKQILNPC